MLFRTVAKTREEELGQSEGFRSFLRSGLIVCSSVLILSGCLPSDDYEDVEYGDGSTAEDIADNFFGRDGNDSDSDAEDGDDGSGSGGDSGDGLSPEDGSDGGSGEEELLTGCVSDQSQGLEYETESGLTGTTDDRGRFDLEDPDGEKVAFYVSGVRLGETFAGTDECVSMRDVRSDEDESSPVEGSNHGNTEDATDRQRLSEYADQLEEGLGIPNMGLPDSTEDYSDEDWDRIEDRVEDLDLADKGLPEDVRDFSDDDMEELIDKTTDVDLSDLDLPDDVSDFTEEDWEKIEAYIANPTPLSVIEQMMREGAACDASGLYVGEFTSSVEQNGGFSFTIDPSDGYLTGFMHDSTGRIREQSGNAGTDYQRLEGRMWLPHDSDASFEELFEEVHEVETSNGDTVDAYYGTAFWEQAVIDGAVDPDAEDMLGVIRMDYVESIDEHYTTYWWNEYDQWTWTVTDRRAFIGVVQPDGSVEGHHYRGRFSNGWWYTVQTNVEVERIGGFNGDMIEIDLDEHIGEAYGDPNDYHIFHGTWVDTRHDDMGYHVMRFSEPSGSGRSIEGAAYSLRFNDVVRDTILGVDLGDPMSISGMWTHLDFIDGAIPEMGYSFEGSGSTNSFNVNLEHDQLGNVGRMRGCRMR